MSEEKEQNVSEEKVAKSAVRRYSWWLAIPLALFALLMISGSWLLYSGPGNRLIIAIALSTYNDMIPGQVNISHFDGTLDSGLCLRDVHLRDRNGRDLVSIQRLNLDLDLYQLTSQLVEIEKLELEGVHVHIYSLEGKSAFLDLAPKADPEARSQKEPEIADGQKPATPIGIQLNDLSIEDLSVTSYDDEQRDLVVGESLALTAKWEGEIASLDLLHLKARVPLIELQIEDLNLNLYWDGENLQLKRAGLKSNLASLDLEKLEFNTFVLDGNGELSANIKNETLRPYLNTNLADDVKATLSVSGNTEMIKADLSLDAGEARLIVHAEGTLEPVPDATVDFRVENIQPQLIDLNIPMAGRFSAVGRARVKGATVESIQAEAELRCTDCRIDPFGPLQLEASASKSPDGVKAESRLQISGAELKATAVLSPEQSLSADWSCSSKDLKRLTEPLDMPPISGRIEARGLCKGELPDLDCDFSSELSDVEALGWTIGKGGLAGGVTLGGESLSFNGKASLAAVNHRLLKLSELTLKTMGNKKQITYELSMKDDGMQPAFIQGGIKLGNIQRIEVSKLDSKLNGVSILLDQAAKIDLEGSALTVHPIAVSIDEGRMLISGSFDPATGQDLSLEIKNIDLNLLKHFKMFPVITGKLETHVQLSGRSASPKLLMKTRLQDLKLRARAVGNIDLSVEAAEGRTVLDIKLSDEEERGELHAELPIALDLKKMTADWNKRGEHQFSWRMTDITPKRVRPLVKMPRKLSFELQSSAKISGPLEQLRGRADIEGSIGYRKTAPTPIHLSLDLLPDGQALSLILSDEDRVPLDLRMTFSTDVMQVMKGQLNIKSIHLKANTKSASFVADGQLDTAGHSTLKAKLRDFDLSTLNDFLSLPPLSGSLDLDTSLEGASRRPELSMVLATRNLQINQLPFLDLHYDLSWKSEQAAMKITGFEGERQLAEITALLPLQLDLSRFFFQWHGSRKHRAEWHLHHLGPRLLKPFADVPEDLQFTMSIEGGLEGNMHQPMLETMAEGLLDYKSLKAAPYLLKVDVGPKRQTLDFFVNQMDRKPLNLHADAEVPLADVFTGRLDVSQVKLDSKLILKDLPLAALTPLVPRIIHNLHGEADTDLAISGTLGSPKIKGRLAVRDTGFSAIMLTKPISGMQTELLIEYDAITIESLSFSSGKGTAMTPKPARFSLDRRNEGELSLELTDFPLSLVGLPENALTSHIDLSLSNSADEMQVQATMKDSSLYLVTKIPKAPRPIPQNRYIVFVDIPKKDLAAMFQGESPKTVSFSLELLDPILVQSPQLDMSWEGKVEGIIKGEDREITAKLELIQGKFDFFGNDFKVERAMISIPAGPDNKPLINLMAASPLPAADVTLTLRGLVESPELKLQSIPRYSQYQIFTMLITGSPETTEDNKNQVAGRAASMGAGLIAYKFPELQRQLNQNLGIDRVGVAYGESATEPIVMIGKRLTKEVYAQTAYHHNAPDDVNQFEFLLEFMPVDQWIIETFYGDRNVAGLDIFWYRSFGGTEPIYEQMEEPKWLWDEEPAEAEAEGSKTEAAAEADEKDPDRPETDRDSRK